MRKAENIKYSKHAEEKLIERGIDKGNVEEILRNPENLMAYIFERDKYPGEKYELYFNLSKRKSLKIVVSFVGKYLNVITAHIISSKRARLVERWRKKHL